MDEFKYINEITKVLTQWYVKSADFLPNLFVGLFIFFLIVATSKYLSKLSFDAFQKFFPESKNKDSILSLIGLFRFIIVLAGAFVSLEIMGLNGFFIKFLGSLGVAGIIAGVALKDLVSSIFSGILVGFDKSFKAGDYINIQNYTGTVEEIGFLTTKIINDEGKKVFIPNQLIFSAPFINITASSHRKIILDLEISTTENFETIQSEIVKILENSGFSEDTNSIEVVLINQRQNVFNLRTIYWTTEKTHIPQLRSRTILLLKKELESQDIIVNTTA